MRLSLNWLQDYIDTSDLTAEELADKLDLSGTAVENVFEEGAGLDKVVVAHIKKISPHPNADRLVLCDVYTGVETVQIVCGAKNMKEGDKVALALPGAVLPGGLQIKKAAIRGEESSGMLASEMELGLADESAGIMILSENLQAGERLDIALGLKDTILELEITPNRPDCMSMIGMAREIGAVLQRDYKIIAVKLQEATKNASDLAKVTIKNDTLCPRYIAKMIADVTVAESPDWMKQRLIAAGARPINNLVDITNYVLFEYGQPLHAFDYELLEGGQIVVRQAKAKEKIVTLDDVERVLTEDCLVIADAKKAVALAGVMGGASSEVNEQTKVVLLEAAYFNPQSIGATSRSLGLISESSIRFERGVDPNGVSYAADRAAQLMAELAGGKVLKGSVDVYPKPYKLRKLKLRPARANAILGTGIEAKKMVETLTSLELEAVSQNEHLEVGVPTFRPDLEREIDLIEEIGRLYGLNKIETTLPKASNIGKATDLEMLTGQLRNQLSGWGLKEAINYSFIDPSDLKILPKEEQNTLNLKNPLSNEQSVLRPSLFPGLLNRLLFNVARSQENVRLFEMGTVFKPTKVLPKEQKHLGFILSGNTHEVAWYSKEESVDFYNAKGLIETILRSLTIAEEPVFEPIQREVFHPQKCYRLIIDEEELGFTGQIHPAFARENDLKQAAYAELDLQLLLKYRQKEVPFKEISPYPGITLDVALLVDKYIKHDEIVRSIREMGHDLLADIKLFDIYEGKGIEEGEKSMAYSLTYQSMERTLELGEVQKIHASILENLKAGLSAAIR